MDQLFSLEKAIAPGAFASETNREARDDAATTASPLPAGRIGKQDDIAAAAVYRASRAGDYVVGQTLVADRGWSHARWGRQAAHFQQCAGCVGRRRNWTFGAPHRPRAARPAAFHSLHPFPACHGTVQDQ